MRHANWLIPICVAVLAFAATGIAQNVREKGRSGTQIAAVTATAGEKTTGKSPRQPVSQIVITPAREAAALTFAQTHHAELAKLLSRLKRRNKTQYERAIRELFRTSERLARLQEVNSGRYLSSLKMWQLDSRIRLLAARMTMSNAPKLEAQLKTLITERQDLRLEQLQQDRDKTQARLDRIDESINKITQDRELAAQNELIRLKKSLGPYRLKARKPSKRPAKRTSTTPNKTTPRKRNPTRGSDKSSSSNSQSKSKPGQ